jgi:hypothetical protein
MDAQAVSAQADAMLLSNPVGKLGSSPGALTFADFGANSLKHGWSEGGVLAAARLVGQSIKASRKEGFDPGADGLLVLPKMAGNLGHAPTSIGETNHLKSITSAGSKSGLASALSKVLALVVSQSYTVHEQ